MNARHQKLRKRPLESGELPAYSTNPVVWAEVQQRLAAIGERLVAGEEYQRSLASDMRWRLNQDYVRDVAWMREDPIEDGVLQFGNARPATVHKEQMEAAE